MVPEPSCDCEGIQISDISLSYTKNQGTFFYDSIFKLFRGYKNYLNVNTSELLTEPIFLYNKTIMPNLLPSEWWIIRVTQSGHERAS